MVTSKNSSRLRSDRSLYFQLDDDGVDYFSPLDRPEYRFPSTTTPCGSEQEPETILSLSRPSSNPPREASIETLVQNAIDNDDVITPKRLQKVVIVHDGDDDDITGSGVSGSQIQGLKDRYGTSDIILDSRIPQIDQHAKHGAPTIHPLELGTTRDVASGAYLAESMDGILKFYPVYRLHPDKTSAHVTGCYPSPEGDGTYKTLDKTDSRKHNLIPVRSRLSGSAPRVTVKDIYDVKGLVTGNGNAPINMSIEGPNEEKGMITPTEFRLLNLADQWRDVGKKFVDDYEKANDGRWPPLGGYTRSGWKKAKAEDWSQEDFRFYKDKLAKTGKMITNLFRPDQESISESIFINLWDPSSYPCYREKSLLADHLTPPSVQPAGPVHLPAYSGCPTIVAPFDQTPFESVISGKEEMHPLAVSIMGPQGSDLMLAEIIDKLSSADVLKPVKTGREAY